ncbi:MAG: ABC transporter permease [Saprospiraceae bacterium]|nr:ABC transporter permease [Saprospiraceae bacterium]
MIQNYFKIAWRNLIRYKGFTAINIIGLTLGLVFALLIGLWVQDELNMNQFHSNIDRLYQVKANLFWSGNEPSTGTGIPGPVEQTLETEVPEIESAAKYHGLESLFTVEETAAKEFGFHVSPDFLELFTFPLLAGNKNTVLSAPDAIVISERMARKYFGTTDVIGKIIEVNKNESLQISGVIKDIPNNSRIQFQWLRPFEAFEKENDWSKTWGNFSFATFVLLRPNANLAAVQQKIKTIGNIKDHRAEIFLQPFSEAYLYSKFENGKVAGGRIEYVRLFSAIALFVLLLACINFMNLATARAAQRAREIGIRKVVGAKRSSLVGQFLGEAMLISLFALLLAIAVANLVLPGFNHLFEKQLSIDYNNPVFWAGALGLTLITGLLAGSYPALILSGFRPVKVLKGDVFKMADGSSLLRKGLVVFQFVLSIFLIIGVTVIQQQIHYVRSKNLGINRQDLFYTILEGKLAEQLEPFRQELMKSPAIGTVTSTMFNPMDIQSSSGDLNWQGKDPNQMTAVSPIMVGNDFIETMGIKLKEGRDFRNFQVDSASYIVNESAVKLMGMEKPIGQEIEFWMGKGPIIGVVEDFHLKSLHEAITPLIICYYPANTWMAWVKPAPGQTEAALAHVEKVTKAMNPGYPFLYFFADDEFEKQYRNETLTGHLANWFAIIAIIISCLGLFGLATYATERRIKEIGVRKVLGASVSDIVTLLSQDFVKLVLVAILIATPIGWWAMNRWLEAFTYRVDIQWWIFVAAGALALMVALLTVSFQAIRAAVINPVDSLRSE